MPITVDECRKQFLRHIDEATNKGKDLLPKKNADSKDKFRYLLNPAVADIANKIKIYKTKTFYELEKDTYTGNSVFKLPADLITVEAIYLNGQKHERYEIRLPNKLYLDTTADSIDITYTYVPEKITIYDNTEDETINAKNEEKFLKQEIDLPNNICYLVALKIAGEALKAENMSLSNYLLNNYNDEISTQIALNQKNNKGSVYFQRVYRM